MRRMVATQLTVSISGGGPYGLRLSDGSDQSIVIVKVRKTGRGDEAGLREGDAVVSVNGRSCKGVGASAVSQWIDNSGQKVTIQVLRNTGDGTPITPAQDKSLETVSISRTLPDQLDHPDQPVPTRTILRQELGPDFTITAPTGVEVQQNADSSFTVTIGMPVQLELGLTNAGLNLETDKHNFAVDDHTKQDVQLQQNEEESLAHRIQPKQLERILSDGSGSEPNTPDDLPRPGKKLFVDSAFYDDPEHKYPTAEEQVQLARQVAMSVISPANLKSKGHRMFMKRKQRAIRWTTGLNEEEKAELADQIAAAKAAEAAGKPFDESVSYSAPQQPQSAPSAMPTSVMFAPRLPKGNDAERLNAMSNEELERMVQSERKTTHTNVSPQVCFSLVDDLKNVKGKGGKLFAKRQARAEKWDAEKSKGQEGSVEEEEEEAISVEPNPHMAEKLKVEHRARADANRGQKSSSGGAPASRLKEMIEVQKAVMTPWDAAAQYGSVEKAFEHMENVHGKQKPGQQNLVDALQQQNQQQQQQRRREGVGGSGAGRGAVRPKSTIGGLGMGSSGKEETEGQRSKIEALGGNPGAGGLAAAMTASLASARASRGAGLRSGRLTTESKPGDTSASAKDHSTANRSSTIGTLNA